MAVNIEVPDGMIAQVAFAFRAKANEYHGAIARRPFDTAAPDWKRQAEWFDHHADRLRDAGAESVR